MESVRRAIARARVHLSRHEALLLIQAILEVDRAYLIAHDEAILSKEQTSRLDDALGRLDLGEPLPYVLEQAPFFGRLFKVTPAVLIPRPETELMIEQVLSFIEEFPLQRPPRIVDVGTGSGCVAITLAAEMSVVGQEGIIQAVDISEQALKISRQNAVRLLDSNNLVGVQFTQGSLLENLKGPFDLIVANLPYIADFEWEGLSPSVRLFEPELALRGGQQGLDLIENLLEQSVEKVDSGGMILLEIGWCQGKAATALARRFFPRAHIKCLKDLGGRDRIIQVKLQ